MKNWRTERDLAEATEASRRCNLATWHPEPVAWNLLHEVKVACFIFKLFLLLPDSENIFLALRLC